MKKFLVFVFATALATSAFAQGSNTEVQRGNAFAHVSNYAGSGGASNLSYHGGPVILQAHVVCIFWQGNNGTPFDSAYISGIQGFRGQFGTSTHYAVITQYTDGAGNKIQTSNLANGTADWVDSSNALPANGNVTDALVQAEVSRYLADTINPHPFDASAIYEVFIPATLQNGTPVYSSSGSSDSCGGPNLQYCAYHSHYTYNNQIAKYSIEPFPSCSGCYGTNEANWTDAQKQEHFVCHETREAVTDALGTAWYDRRGSEADDKCAWTPNPFLDGGFGYQWEWSNAASGCVQ